jgi:hypothetical protein
VCTATWLRSTSGYTLFFNRDESPTRAAAIPPETRTIEGVTVLAPIDGDFGGTWIGVNRGGATVALLNRYQDSTLPGVRGRISRGLLVKSLLPSPNITATLATLQRTDLRDYAPFTLLALEPGHDVAIADWNGSSLVVSYRAEPGVIRTSHGEAAAEVDRSRRALYDEFVRARGATFTSLLAYQSSHLPERGSQSVCMHRAQANTVSLTVVDVADDLITMLYTPGPPCQTPFGPPLSFERTPAAVDS